MKETELVAFLKSYTIYEKHLTAHQYANEYFDKFRESKLEDENVCKKRMVCVEGLIDLLKPSNEYTLLQLHYIRGIAVGKCAECMQISERTAYRMLQKAHKTIYEMLQRKDGRQ